MTVETPSVSLRYINFTTDLQGKTSTSFTSERMLKQAQEDLTKAGIEFTLGTGEYGSDSHRIFVSSTVVENLKSLGANVREETARTLTR